MADLVPVSFPRAKPAAPAKSTQTYQHTLRYALTSVRGEPLEFTIVPGTIAHHRDMAPAKWGISRASGEGVAGDSLPLDGKPHPDLVIGADGRSSVVRDRAGLVARDLGAPIDVLWFRLS